MYKVSIQKYKALAIRILTAGVNPELSPREGRTNHNFLLSETYNPQPLSKFVSVATRPYLSSSVPQDSTPITFLGNGIRQVHNEAPYGAVTRR